MAFNIQTNAGCISLGQAERERAADWLPPGMAYADVMAGDEVADSSFRDAGESPDSGPADDALIDGDTDGGDGAEIDSAADELPAFLTEDGLDGAAFNEASAVGRAFSERGPRGGGRAVVIEREGNREGVNPAG